MRTRSWATRNGFNDIYDGYEKENLKASDKVKNKLFPFTKQGDLKKRVSNH